MGEQPLPDAELDVISCLWRLGEATARQVRETLGAKRPLSHASVCTLLRRLEAKGLVTREKGPKGKAFLYQATTKPTKTRRSLVSDLLQRAFDGSGVELVAALFQSRPPSADEIDQLQALLDDLRRKSKKKGTRKGTLR